MKVYSVALPTGRHTLHVVAALGIVLGGFELGCSKSASSGSPAQTDAAACVAPDASASDVSSAA